MVLYEVAVGTALSGRAPHRSEHALLAHSALASGADVKALFRPRVQNCGMWEPSPRDRLHPVPVHAAALASAPKRSVPCKRYLSPEALERVDVRRHGVVGEVPSHHLAEPPALFGYR
jgi:hypothetical protein